MTVARPWTCSHLAPLSFCPAQAGRPPLVTTRKPWQEQIAAGSRGGGEGGRQHAWQAQPSRCISSSNNSASRRRCQRRRLRGGDHRSCIVPAQSKWHHYAMPTEASTAKRSALPVGSRRPTDHARARRRASRSSSRTLMAATTCSSSVGTAGCGRLCLCRTNRVSSRWCRPRRRQDREGGACRLSTPEGAVRAAAAARQGQRVTGARVTRASVKQGTSTQR